LNLEYCELLHQIKLFLQVPGEAESSEVGMASKTTIESVKATERIMEAIEVCSTYITRFFANVLFYYKSRLGNF